MGNTVQHLTKKQYRICRLLGDFNVRLPTRCNLGPVELIPLDKNDEIVKYVNKSLNSYGEKCNLSVAMMLSCDIEASTYEEADYNAGVIFNKVLDVLDTILNCGVSKLSLLNAGVYQEIGVEKIHPRTTKSFNPLTSFIVKDDGRLGQCRYLLSGDNESELSDRYLKSIHWSRASRWENNPQLSILFKWFSMEAILTLNKDDDIVPRIMWALGYPTGKAASRVNQDLIQSLAVHPKYKAWRSQIKKRLNAISTFRNNTVHDGFRYYDMDARDLRGYKTLIKLACSRVQNMALVGMLNLNIKTTRELINHYPEIIGGNNNYINDVHHNIFHILEHPE